MRNHPEPHLPFYLTPFLQALNDLSGDRINTHMGVNGIPFAAKRIYCDAFSLELEPFLEIMNVVDDVFVEKTNQKIQRMAEQNGRH